MAEQRDSTTEEIEGLGNKEDAAYIRVISGA